MVKFTSEYFGFNVGNVLEHQGWSLCLWVFKDVEELHDVGTSIESLKNLHFSVLLLNANWLQDLDDALLIVL